MQLAKRAVNEAMKEITGRPKPLVAACVSPYATHVAGEYSGDYKGIDDEGLKEFHRNRLIILASEKPDILAMETVPRLQEVRVLMELLNEPEIDALNIPAYIAVCCRDAEHLTSGETVEDLVALINDMKPKTRLL